MAEVTIYDAGTGRIVAVVSPSLRAGVHLDAGQASIAGAHDEGAVYISDGAALPRPALDMPEQHAVTVGADWILPGIPAGTEVVIGGDHAGTSDQDGLALVFPSAGVWRVELRPPFPWRRAICEVNANED
jgi:hypothetical protein